MRKMKNASKQKLLLFIASELLDQSNAHTRSSLRGNTDLIHSHRDLSTRTRRLPQQKKDLAKRKRMNDERKRKNEQRQENEWKSLMKDEKKKLLEELKNEEEDVAEMLSTTAQDEQMSPLQQYATLLTTSLDDIDADSDQTLNKLWTTLTKDEKKLIIDLDKGRSIIDKKTGEIVDNPAYVVDKLNKKEKKEQIKLQMAQNSAVSSSSSEQATTIIVKPGKFEGKDDITQNSDQGSNNAGNFVIPMPELTSNEDHVDILVSTTAFPVDNEDVNVPDDMNQNSEQTTNSTNSEASSFVVPGNLYYPMENRCINDGNQPDHLTPEEMFDTIEACCEHHYGWSTDCVTGGSDGDTSTSATDTTDVTPTMDTTGWYYPTEGFCYNTGTPPNHIKDTDMFETLEACCEFHYSWSTDCVTGGSEGNTSTSVSDTYDANPDLVDTTGWYYPNEGFCYNTGTPQQHIKDTDMFETLEACCEYHYSWSTECLQVPSSVSSNSNTAATLSPEIDEEPNNGEFTFASNLIDPSVRFESAHLKWTSSGHGWIKLDSSRECYSGKSCVQSGITNEVIGSSVMGEPVYSNLTLTTEKEFKGGVLTFQRYEDDVIMPSEVFYVAVDDKVTMTRGSLDNKGWVEYSVPVGRGVHTVTWSHVYNPLALEALPGRQGEPILRMDDLRFSPFDKMSDQGFEGNQSNSLHMTSDGDAVWQVDNEDSNSGEYSIIAKTSSITKSSGSSNVSFVLHSEYGGTLKYKISTSTTAPYDDFAILLNDKPVDAVVGPMQSFEYRSLDVPMGKVMVTLQHRKNPGNLNNEVLEAFGHVSTGLTRLDDVRFEPRYK